MVKLETLTLSIAGIDELSGYEGRGVSHIVSLIDPEEPTPAAIPRLGGRSHLMLRLHDVIDAHAELRAPERSDVERLLDHADTLRRDHPDHLLVHCHMGRSRSTAAAAVMLYHLQAGAPDAIFQHIAAVRDPIWPNSRILALADEMLGTGGALVQACRPIYRAVADRHPDWIAPFAHSSRMRDLHGAAADDAGRPDVAIKDKAD